MARSVLDKEISRIYGKGRGWVFTPKDFSDLGDRVSIDTGLHRLVSKGRIRRIGRGLYDFPKESKLLNKKLSPDYFQVAEAIARKNGWTIVPAGESILNRFGLSTQISSQYVFDTDGKNRTFEVDGATLQFRKAPLQDMHAKNKKATLLVRAIKTLGKERINEKIIKALRNAVSSREYSSILRDTKMVTGWVYEVIKRICAVDA